MEIIKSRLYVLAIRIININIAVGEISVGTKQEVHSTPLSSPSPSKPCSSDDKDSPKRVKRFSPRSSHQQTHNKKFKENDETINLSTARLHRMLLLEQLKLIKLKIRKEEIILDRLENNANIFSENLLTDFM